MHIFKLFWVTVFNSFALNFQISPDFQMYFYFLICNLVLLWSEHICCIVSISVLRYVLCLGLRMFYMAMRRLYILLFWMNEYVDLNQTHGALHINYTLIDFLPS